MARIVATLKISWILLVYNILDSTDKNSRLRQLDPRVAVVTECKGKLAVFSCIGKETTRSSIFSHVVR